MRIHAVSQIAATAAAALCVALAGCAYVKHVPPGQSLSEALAIKPILVAMPPPPPQPAQPNGESLPGAAPEVPTSVQTEKVADDFTLGNFCLQQQRYGDAVKAYEDAVKADPDFAEAWNNLAVAYQDLGDNAKAMEAFKKYKTVALH